MDAVNGMRKLEGWSTKEEVRRGAFRKLEGLHLPSLLQKVCAHTNLKDATIRSTQAHIHTLTTEQWGTFHLDHPDNKDFVIHSAGMRQFCSYSVRRLAQSTGIYFSHLHSCRCKNCSRSCSSGHVAAEDWTRKLGVLGRRQNLEVPAAVAKVEKVDRCTSVADWKQGSGSVTADHLRAERTSEEG